MVAKNTSPSKVKTNGFADVFGFKPSDSATLPASQIKMLDGNFSNKERKQVVMKLIQFMKAT